VDRLGPARFHVPSPTKLPTVGLDANVVSPGYFAAMGLVPVAGTVFGEDFSHGCRVGVINQEAAERYFGGNAVGAAVIDATGRRTEIIGVVRSAPLRSAQRRVEPAIYYPVAQDVRPRMTLVLGVPDASCSAYIASIPTMSVSHALGIRLFDIMLMMVQGTTPKNSCIAVQH